MAGIAGRGTLPALFQHYDLDEAHDEMLDSSGAVRAHYRHLYDTLLELPAEELDRRKQIADLSFLHQGITFTVYGRDEGTERIFPNDLLPRILTGEEWSRIERRPYAAHHRAEPVPEGSVSRRPHPERRRGAARAGV